MANLSVIKNIIRTCDEIGNVDLSGVKLEDASPELLDVTSLSLDVHVAMQPAALAYYGTMRREAERYCARRERDFDRWQKKQYAKAKETFSSGASKATINDIDAKFVVDNEVEIERWEDELEELRKQRDCLAEHYEAWRQKGFSLREYIAMNTAEAFSTNNIQSNQKNGGQQNNSENQSRVDNVRRILKQRQEGN